MCDRLPKAIFSQVAQLADQLAEHLQPGRDRLLVSWYFMQHWAPLLTPEQTVLVILLRDRCYISPQEVRDSGWVHGGFAELAARLGLARAKTVEGWFPPFFSQFLRLLGDPQSATGTCRARLAQTQALLARFVTRMDARTTPEGRAWQFRVNLAEPLLPEHELLQTVLLELAEDGEEGGVDLLEGLLSPEPDPSLAARLVEMGTRFAASYPERGRDLQAQNGFGDALCSFINPNGDANCRDTGTRFAGYLKHLIQTTFNLKALQSCLNHTASISTSTTTGAAVVCEDPEPPWDFERLLQWGGLSTARRQEIREDLAGDNQAQERFLGWCLYGFAQASTPARAGIDAPVVFAFTRFRDSQPGPKYLHLARLAPAALNRLIASQAALGAPPGVAQVLRRLGASPLARLLSTENSSKGERSNV